MEPGAPPAAAPSSPPAVTGRPIDLDAGPTDPVGRWVAVVLAAAEPCLLLDADGRVQALSAAAAELLGTTLAAAQGRPVESVLTLVDFSRRALPVTDPVSALPALRSVVHRVLARSLLRVQPAGLRQPVTCDMVAAPLAGGAAVAFLLPV